MSILIAAVLFGLGFAYLATQNTGGVALRAGSYLFSDIPLYLVVLGSLLVGLLVSWILSSIGWISSAMTIRGKENQIRSTEATADDLRKKIQQLERENSKLRGEEKVIERNDEQSDRPTKNFFDRFKNHPTTS